MTTRLICIIAALTSFLVAIYAYTNNYGSLMTAGGTFGCCMLGTCLGNYLSTKIAVGRKVQEMPLGRKRALLAAIFALAALNLVALYVAFQSR